MAYLTIVQTPGAGSAPAGGTLEDAWDDLEIVISAPSGDTYSHEILDATGGSPPTVTGATSQVARFTPTGGRRAYRYRATVNVGGIVTEYTRTIHVSRTLAGVEIFGAYRIASGERSGERNDPRGLAAVWDENFARIDAAIGGGGGPPLSGATPQPVGILASAGASTEASRADHVHPHGNLAASDALHAAATGAVAGFMSSSDKTKLDASTSAATASALCQRDGSGFLAVSRLTTPDLRAQTSGLDIGGDPIVLGSPTLEIADAIGGNQVAVCTVGASARVEIQDYCTSFELRWAASGAGAGAATTIQGQQGAAGSAGGSVTIRTGAGGTSGTDLPGDLILDLGARSAANSGRLRLRAGGVNLCDEYDTPGSYIVEPLKSVTVSSGTASYGISTLSPYMQSISTGAGVQFTAGATFYTNTFLESAGQISCDAEEPAFSATPTLNFNLSNHQRIGALTGNITSLGASNLRDGAVYTVSVQQDGVGGRTITWSAAFAFGVTYNGTPAAGANARTIWTFLSDGTTARCISKETF